MVAIALVLEGYGRKFAAKGVSLDKEPNTPRSKMNFGTLSILAEPSGLRNIPITIYPLMPQSGCLFTSDLYLGSVCRALLSKYGGEKIKAMIDAYKLALFQQSCEKN